MGLVQLKYARRGKKAAVTNRIKDLERIMSEGGRRTVVRLLRDGLLTVFGELYEVCMKISAFGEEDEYNCLEGVRTKVDACAAVVEDYLEARKDQPPSEGSVTSSYMKDYTRKWLRETQSGNGSGSGSDGSASRIGSQSPARSQEGVHLPGMDDFLVIGENDKFLNTGIQGLTVASDAVTQAAAADLCMRI